MSDPEAELTALFTALNLPGVPALVPPALTALKRHSQGAMFDNDATKWGRLSQSDYDRADAVMVRDIGLAFGANSTLAQYSQQCQL